MPIEAGDEFIDIKAFKAAISDWSIAGEHKFTFRYQRPDKMRNIVVVVCRIQFADAMHASVLSFQGNDMLLTI